MISGPRRNILIAARIARHPDLARQFAANAEDRMSRNSPPCITARRGGRAIQKISRSIRLSRGRGGFPMNPKGKPPRLRLFRSLRQIFFDDAATPPCRGAKLNEPPRPRLQSNGTIYLMARPPLLCQGVDFAFPAGCPRRPCPADDLWVTLKHHRKEGNCSPRSEE